MVGGGSFRERQRNSPDTHITHTLQSNTLTEKKKKTKRGSKGEKEAASESLRVQRNLIERFSPQQLYPIETMGKTGCLGIASGRREKQVKLSKLSFGKGGQETWTGRKAQCVVGGKRICTAEQRRGGEQCL